MASPPPKPFDFGPFRLDPGERLVLRNGKPVALTPKAFDVLALLIERRGHLVEKAELMNEIWADCFVEEANLTRTIWMLRQALGDGCNGNSFIQTIPKHGYRFAAEQSNVEYAQPESEEPISGSSNGHSPQKAGNVSKEAYELYLRGRYHLRRETKESVQEAIQLQKKATKLDQNFALAYTELARAYHLNAFYYTPQEKHYDEKAWVACEWAIKLDPQLAEAHFVRGLLLWTHANGFPHEQVIDEYKRALELDPGLDEAHHQIGLVLHHIGLLEEALDHYSKALEINPANNIVRVRFGIVHQFKHQYDEALRIVNTLPADMTPGPNILRGMALCHLYRLEEAQEFSDKWLIAHQKDEGGLMTSIQAVIAALNNNKCASLAKVERSIEIGRGYGHFHHSTYNIATAFALLDLAADAINWLEFTFNDGFPCYPMIEGDPFLQSLHGDSRYGALMSKQKQLWTKRIEWYETEPTPFI
jgi:DNA-binding winged helix-turn-helix (wHTH) protein